MTESVPSDETPLDVDVAFDLLSNARRRGVLYALERDGATTVGELAPRIAAWQAPNGDPSPEQVRTSLVHAHLPRLDEAGVVDYEPETGRVEPIDVDSLDPLLRAASEPPLPTVDVDRQSGLAD